MVSPFSEEGVFRLYGTCLHLSLPLPSTVVGNCHFPLASLHPQVLLYYCHALSFKCSEIPFTKKLLVPRLKGPCIYIIYLSIKHLISHILETQLMLNKYLEGGI